MKSWTWACGDQKSKWAHRGSGAPWASLVSFLCAVKRDKGGRASADDSSKEERVRGHAWCRIIVPGGRWNCICVRLSILSFVRSVEDVLERDVLKRFCFCCAALIWRVWWWWSSVLLYVHFSTLLIVAVAVGRERDHLGRFPRSNC